MTPEVQKAFSAFRINMCGVSSGIDMAHEVLPQIHAIATLLEMGFRVERDGSSTLSTANPELVAAAFDGLANLASIAMLNLDEL